MSAKPLPAVMTLAEAAEFLRLDPKTVVRYVHRGLIRGRLCGRHWRFLRATLEAFVDADPALARQAAGI